MIVLRQLHHAFYISNEWGDNQRVGLSLLLAYDWRKQFFGPDVSDFSRVVFGLGFGLILIFQIDRP
jgi:hypothetical protein